jgi:hypothetical protein
MMADATPEYPAATVDLNRCGFVENCDADKGEYAYYRLIHKEEKASGKIIIWWTPIDVWDDGKMWGSETVRIKKTPICVTVNREDFLPLGKGSHSKDFDCYKVIPPRFERMKEGLKNISPDDAEKRYNDWLIHLVEHRHTTEAIIKSQSNQLEQRDAFLKDVDLRKLKDYRETADYFQKEFGMRPAPEASKPADESKGDSK